MNSLIQYANGSLVPSPKDLVLALPRLAQRAGNFAFYTVPEQIDGFMGKMVGGGSVIAEQTSAEMINASATNFTKAFLQAVPSARVGSMATATAAQASVTAAETLSDNAWGLQTIRNLGGMFGYLMTRWALGTFFVSVLLNRTQFYASSRTPLRLQWHTRLALYLVPMYILSSHILQITQAIRCQSSPNWPELRYGDATKHIGMDYAGEGGMLYSSTSLLLFWQDESESCAAVNMAHSATAGRNLLDLSGSLALLWPLFLTLCLSQFIETLSCALQGRQTMAETGMTIFEHSLAFCEAEAMLVRPWELAGKVMDHNAVYTPDNVDRQLTRAFLKGFMNVPQEVLVICLISALSHLSSNFLAVLDKRKQYRLINTSIWALCYMGCFIWSVYRFIAAPLSATANPTTAISIGLIRFPTVCIVGFIPHLVILAGIIVCACVYALALFVTALSPPETAPHPTSLYDRFAIAYQNLQANVHFSAVTPITVYWHDDFYTSLLKIGFALLTSASEAVYLNEGVPVRVAAMTWLEKKRYDELVQRRGLLYRKTFESIPQDLRSSGGIAAGVSTTDAIIEDSTVVARGYAVERKSMPKDQESAVLNESAFNNRGVGFMQRHWRWAMAFRFFKGVFWLISGLNAQCLIFVLEKLGVERRPAILIRLAGSRSTTKTEPSPVGLDSSSQNNGLQFWLLDDEGHLRLPRDNNVDVEAEMRKRVYSSTTFNPRLTEEDQEEQLDKQTYNWWKSGGWWGELDSSGDYDIPSSQFDDDTTSVVSMSTNASVIDDEWHTDPDDGRRTPTQSDPYTFARAATPFDSNPINDALETSRLAELLDPQTVEQQNEARMLARHLRNDTGPLTRSRYNRQLDLDRSRVLGTSALRQRSKLEAARSAEEEEKELEGYILERRSAAQDGLRPSSEGWHGTICVVCQFNPRTILSWPCGCLSMCDECRIGLATRNYSNCVCCRTGVSAFSRIWVP